jgi:hypothetical protein
MLVMTKGEAMEIRQISVFLENTTGRMGDVTGVLAKADINIRAISIADTADFGILRLIVDKYDEAVKALSDAGFTTRLSNVEAIEIDDVPGSLAKIMELFQKSQVNIDYLYASLESKAGKAVVIFKMKDHEKGLAIIKENGLSTIDHF